MFSVYGLFSSTAGGRYLDFAEFLLFCQGLGLKTVPVVDAAFVLPADVAALIAMADGKSLLCPDTDREGLVFRPLIEQREETHGGRLSFKAVSNQYLLRAGA